MGNIGLKELLVILLIALLLFGAKKVPELAKGLGSGLREFKKAARELDPDSGGDSAKAASSNVAPPAGESSASDGERS